MFKLYIKSFSLFTVLSLLVTSQLLSQNRIYIKVYPHIMTDATGQLAISKAELEESKSQLDKIFNRHSIYFDYQCPDYIVNDFLVTAGVAAYLCDDWLLDYHNDDGIDMFIGSDEGEPSAFAIDIPGGAFGVSGKWGNPIDPNYSEFVFDPMPVATSRSSIIAHEMGHALGLFHTFQSTDYTNTMFPCSTTGLNITSCPELVNGSNCEQCGDLVCDTPADPNGGYNPSTCRYNDALTDSNGDYYQPDGKNVMSYAGLGCDKHITKGQASRIKMVMQGSPFLSKKPEPNQDCDKQILPGIRVRSSASSSFKLYPNPAKDIIYLENPEKLECNVKIINTIGEEIGSYFGLTSKLIYLPTSSLSAGSYIIHVTDLFGSNLLVKKIIIIK